MLTILISEYKPDKNDETDDECQSDDEAEKSKLFLFIKRQDKINKALVIVAILNLHWSFQRGIFKTIKKERG